MHNFIHAGASHKHPSCAPRYLVRPCTHTHTLKHAYVSWGPQAALARAWHRRHVQEVLCLVEHIVLTWVAGGEHGSVQGSTTVWQQRRDRATAPASHRAIPHRAAYISTATALQRAAGRGCPRRAATRDALPRARRSSVTPHGWSVRGLAAFGGRGRAASAESDTACAREGLVALLLGGDSGGRASQGLAEGDVESMRTAGGRGVSSGGYIYIYIYIYNIML